MWNCEISKGYLAWQCLFLDFISLPIPITMLPLFYTRRSIYMLYIKKLEDELSKESICVFNTFENIILKHLKKI